jgi:hypothetical protein
MEQDFSAYDNGISLNKTALVGFASKGPINVPTRIGNTEELFRIFGTPNPDIDSFLIYSAIQYLREGGDLVIVRAGQDDEGSADFARTAWVDIPSGGNHATLVSGVDEGSWGGTMLVLASDRFIRLRSNRTSYVRELRIPADIVFTSLTNAGGVSATSLESILAAQITEDDGFEITHCGTGTSARLVIRSRINGPDSTLELVSTRMNIYNDGVVGVESNNVDTGWPLNFGQSMDVVAKLGTASSFNSSVPGVWNLTGYMNLRLEVVVFGTGDPAVDGAAQVIKLPMTEDGANFNVATTQELVDFLNGVHVGSVGTVMNSPQGFWFAANGDQVEIHAGYADTYPTEAAPLTPTTAWWLTGADAKLLVRPTSTALTILGLDNIIEIGTQDPAFEDSSTSICSPSASKLLASSVYGINYDTPIPLNTMRIFAATPGTEGNHTEVDISVNNETSKIDIKVWHRGVNVENFVGLHKDQDNQDDIYYIERYINGFSDYIAVEDEIGVEDLPRDGRYTIGSTVLTDPQAGTDGIPATPEDQAALLSGDPVRGTGLYSLAEPEAIDIDLVAVPGVSTTSVISTMKLICEEIRLDCMFIVDPPFGMTPLEVKKWHNGQHPLNTVKFNSSYGALYWPWLKITDPYNGIDVWMPPSGSVLAIYARTDSISWPWIAPAGLRRAIMDWVIETEMLPYQSVRDTLYADDNAVNCIVDFPVEGPTIFGQKTLQRFPTALDRVNVRRMLLYAEKTMRQRARFLIFEPHDFILRQEFIKLADGIMSTIETNRGAYAHIVICDETLNTDEVVDRNELRARIGIQPTKAAEFIFITFTLHRTGSFENSAIGPVPTRVR